MSAEIQPEDLNIIMPILRTLNPRVIVEIGTYYGGSYGLWKETFNPDVLITIDITKLANIKGDYIIASSQNAGTQQKVKEILKGKEIDFLFIDGDHSYQAVKRDFELYSPLVREGGLIMFHDVLYRYSDGDVPTYWKEIKKHFDYIEIAQNNDTTGVGIIRKSNPYERTYHGNVT